MQVFADNSWYFRNSLVRANYKNFEKKVFEDTSFLEKFFYNLLSNTNYELKNRYAHIDYVKDKHKLLIGDRTAEDVKFKLGAVYNGDSDNKMEIKGRNLSKGLPYTIEITEKEIEEALYPLAMEIVKKAKEVLEKTPPELSADIVDKGIVLTGGGALVKGMPELFEQELKVPVFISESPLTCVAEGCGIMLTNLDLIDK